MSINNTKVSPMMKQFLDIKQQYSKEILMFRLGDFYEMFFDDAIEASKILQLTLTKRHDVPMCGVPHHASKNYFYKLIQAGKKIAVAEQIIDPNNKNLMKRKVVEVITPSTTIDFENLTYEKNNYLCSIYFNERSNDTHVHLFFSSIDVSTGELECHEEKTNDIKSALYNFLTIYQPKEIVLPEYYSHVLPKNFFKNQPIIINAFPHHLQQKHETIKIIKEVYQINHINDLKINNHEGYLFSIAFLFYYLQLNYQQNHLNHIKHPFIIKKNHHLQLDHNTIKNLEILENNSIKNSQNTLFHAIDETLTPMGKRRLQQYLLKPLLDITMIEERQSKALLFYKNPAFLDELRNPLKKVYDFSRFCSKIALGRVLPKELITFKHSLTTSLSIIKIILNSKIINIRNLNINNLQKILQTLNQTIMETPNNNINEGGVINENIDDELKRYNNAKKKGNTWILDLLENEKKKIGIPSLKIKYTEQSGYFFEITKSHLHLTPKHFIHKKTMVNASRFITAELIKIQEDILEAKDKAIHIEIQHYQQLKDDLKIHLKDIQDICDEIAYLDVIQSFAYKALYNNYSLPIFHDKREIDIKEGRHPLIEQRVENYIHNDLTMSGTEYIHILTGPNMAGKSTYLRQNALIILLAQIGSFVPATSAKLPIIDKLFTRIGASDNLSEGQSTFLVEMSESAYILNEATENSFIIMDEIGRGTSTYDGMSIAHAILNYICQSLNSFTLFATHYHELSDLNKNKSIENYTMSIEKKGEDIYFLRKVIKGIGNHSYGIHVAKLSGLPQKILDDALKTLKIIEKSIPNIKKPLIQSSSQTFFDLPPVKKNNEKHSQIIEKIKDFDLNNHSPLQTLQFLNEIKKEL